MDVGPGDLVECLRACEGQPIRVGGIYSVEAIEPGSWCSRCGETDHGGFRLLDIPAPEINAEMIQAGVTNPVWAACAFRPIKRRPPEFFTGTATTDDEVGIPTTPRELQPA